MPRVVLTETLKQFTGGVGEVDIDATTIRQMLVGLGERYPDLKPHLDEGLAVAIDGQIFQDAWFEPIPAEAEVHLLPQIGGG